MSTSTTVSTEKTLPKPNWNNIQKRMLYRNCNIGMAVSFVAGVCAYYFWYVPKWQWIENYQRNYDPFAEMERMRNLGLFQCCPPDDVIAKYKEKNITKKFNRG